MRKWFLLVNCVCFTWLMTLCVVAGQTRTDFDQLRQRIYEEQAAQDRQIITNTQHLGEVERRLGQLDAMQIDQRLAKLETSFDLIIKMQVALIIAVALLVIETTVKWFLGLRQTNSVPREGE